MTDEQNHRMTSNPNSLDFIDLMEYDEFEEYDVYQTRSYPQIASNTEEPNNVPLSVELSESTNSDSTKETFVKGSELFLRIDSVGASISSSSGGADEQDECSSDTPTNANNCVELQYENEFESNEDDADNNCDGSNLLGFNSFYHSAVDNENEQLLLEGILVVSFLCVCVRSAFCLFLFCKYDNLFCFL